MIFCLFFFVPEFKNLIFHFLLYHASVDLLFVLYDFENVYFQSIKIHTLTYSRAILYHKICKVKHTQYTYTEFVMDKSGAILCHELSRNTATQHLVLPNSGAIYCATKSGANIFSVLFHYNIWPCHHTWC